MAEWNPRANDLFLSAAEIDAPSQRQAFLDEQCGGDAQLRKQVEQLLAASDKVGSFLDRPAQVAEINGATVLFEPIAEGPGSVIGSYKLLQKIGEGGMGVVYMAEQQEPVRRKVALKIIKPGMDSAQVIARFEAERQALALMDHQNIAKVFDGGTTASGRPYFVMELVHGVPLTRFCDDNRLTPRERLALFVPVCQAIQHAHHKGVIHRDIKPSNVLVTMYDDKPVPKVIDFGVAKAVEQRLTERTLFMQYGALVGTFEYMSPEQAEMNALGVDTRSDVYSLGVLLYELLTGTTPLERKRLRQAALDEMVRLIKEEDPPRPSARLSSSGTLATIAAARKTEPARLSRLIRGEIDWIVMKCLEKDRARRYETANGDGRRVCAISIDAKILTWDLALPDRKRIFREPGGRLSDTAAGGNHFAAAWHVAGDKIVLKVWDEAGKLLFSTTETILANWNAATSLVLSPDGSRLAYVVREYAIASGKRSARCHLSVWDVASGSVLYHKAEEDAGNHRACTFSADGRRLAYARSAEMNLAKEFSARVTVYDLDGRKELLAIDAPGYVHLSLSPDGSRLAAGLIRSMLDKPEGELMIWDIATGGVLVSRKGFLDIVSEPAWDHDGTRLALRLGMTGDCEMHVVAADSGEDVQAPFKMHGTQEQHGFSPDGRRLVSCTWVRGQANAEVKIWDTSGGRELLHLPIKGNGNFAFSPDGRRLFCVSGQTDGAEVEVQTWDATPWADEG